MMVIANLIIIKILMMQPSSDVLGFLILTIRQKIGILEPEKTSRVQPTAAAQSIFFKWLNSSRSR
jgi:hypothetical protein